MFDWKPKAANGLTRVGGLSIWVEVDRKVVGVDCRERAQRAQAFNEPSARRLHVRGKWKAGGGAELLICATLCKLSVVVNDAKSVSGENKLPSVRLLPLSDLNLRAESTCRR